MIDTWEFLFYLHCHNSNDQFYNYMKNLIYVTESWNLKNLTYRLNVDKEKGEIRSFCREAKVFF